LSDPAVDAPLLEICARPLAGRLPERLLVEARREVHHPEELLPARIATLAAFLGQRDPRRLGECPDGLGEGEAVLAHEEAECVAAYPAAEAVEDPLARIDRERRRLLRVERAEALPAGTGLAEVHEPADEVDDVDGRANVVEQRLRVLHHPTFSAATVAPVPPSDGSPSRNDSTRGWPARRLRTVLRRAPVPFP